MVMLLNLEFELSIMSFTFFLSLFPYTTLFRSTRSAEARVCGLHLVAVDFRGLSFCERQTGFPQKRCVSRRDHCWMLQHEIGRAHVRTPVTWLYRMPSSA